MATIFETPAELAASAGKHLGHSAWMEVTQERIQLFADATDDQQWIHVDPGRAAQGPFGAPIAHGYLTLSLVNRFLPEIVEVRGISMGVNYGADRIRFPAPVKVGSSVRATRELLEAELVAPNTIQLKQKVTVEIVGEPKPGCVAEFLTRLIYG